MHLDLWIKPLYMLKVVAHSISVSMNSVWTGRVDQIQSRPHKATVKIIMFWVE